MRLSNGGKVLTNRQYRSGAALICCLLVTRVYPVSSQTVVPSDKVDPLQETPKAVISPIESIVTGLSLLGPVKMTRALNSEAQSIATVLLHAQDRSSKPDTDSSQAASIIRTTFSVDTPPFDATNDYWLQQAVAKVTTRPLQSRLPVRAPNTIGSTNFETVRHRLNTRLSKPIPNLTIRARR